MFVIQGALQTAAELAAGPIGARLPMPLAIAGSALLSGGLAAKVRERLLARRPHRPAVSAKTQSIMKAAVAISDYESAKKSDDEGERKAAEELRRAGIPYLRSVILPSGARIDHVVLAGRVLVCLDVRTWQGKVYGGLTDRRWSVVDRAGARKQHPNPVERSGRQAEALGDFLGGYPHLRGYAVMAGPAAFDLVPPQTVRLEDLIEVLHGIAREGAPDKTTLASWKRLAGQRKSKKAVRVVAASPKAAAAPAARPASKQAKFAPKVVAGRDHRTDRRTQT